MINTGIKNNKLMNLSIEYSESFLNLFDKKDDGCYIIIPLQEIKYDTIGKFYCVATTGNYIQLNSHPVKEPSHKLRVISTNCFIYNNKLYILKVK